jgi:hypothetical protein
MHWDFKLWEYWEDDGTVSGTATVIFAKLDD